MRCFGLLNSKYRNTLLPCLHIFTILDARARKVCILEIASVERGTVHLVTSQNGKVFYAFPRHNMYSRGLQAGERLLCVKSHSNRGFPVSIYAAY